MYVLPICTYLLAFVCEFCRLVQAGLSVDKYFLSDLMSVFRFYIFIYKYKTVSRKRLQSKIL